MLTRIIIKNFKRFGKVDIELGNPVVLIGPNNSGKSSALQALVLWNIGLNRWKEKRSGNKTPEKRPGVTINRRDLIAAPIPEANLLWKNLHVRDVKKGKTGPITKNVRIEIIVEGVTKNKSWQCGLEFDYANIESFYCRPLRISDKKNPERMPIPEAAEQVQIAFLPPMSGLSSNETRLDQGAINVRIGEGRTAEVLRNLCYELSKQNKDRWLELIKNIERLFGAKIGRPEYISERGEIIMSYTENNIKLDISSSGRGLQQTLLLLAYMYANPGAVILLDEPDAHLEILRQRQIYQILTDIARENGNQIIAASHSEVLLNEAAARDVVVAFVGKPHRIDNRKDQVLKALRDIGFEHYYQAEQTGWVLYLEGSSDLAILRSFAELLNYEEAVKVLERPYVHYVGNVPNEVRKHFFGLREAVPYLKGIVIFDRLEQELQEDMGVKIMMWKRREIENYLCYPETLEAFASSTAKMHSPGDLFTSVEIDKHLNAMRRSIKEVEDALKTLGKYSPWDSNTKVSDDFLVPLFHKYYKKLGLPNVMAKKNFNELARFLQKDNIDPEIKEKLDAIVEVAMSATPAQESRDE